MTDIIGAMTPRQRLAFLNPCVEAVDCARRMFHARVGAPFTHISTALTVNAGGE